MIPITLSMVDFVRQVFWSSGVDLPQNYPELIEEITLDMLEQPASEKAVLSLQLPAERVHWTGVRSTEQHAALRGITGSVRVYQIP
jgi:hypothetical protein